MRPVLSLPVLSLPVLSLPVLSLPVLSLICAGSALAQQTSPERAETRLLDRSVPAFRTDEPSRGAVVARCGARCLLWAPATAWRQCSTWSRRRRGRKPVMRRSARD